MAEKPGQFAEVLVEGEEDSVPAHRARQDVAIRTAGGIAADPGDIVADGAQGRHGIVGYVLVGEEAHASGGACGRQRIDLFGLQHLARIGEAGGDGGASAARPYGGWIG